MDGGGLAARGRPGLDPRARLLRKSRCWSSEPLVSRTRCDRVGQRPTAAVPGAVFVRQVVVSRAHMAAPAEFVGKRVGRVTIVSHLASGGMAELFIARQEAVGGFEKHLVLKMLQERYATNPRVLQMFLDEARLAAKLNHQNIVHVYDVDRAEGIHYIAMEYIHGET